MVGLTASILFHSRRMDSAIFVIYKCMNFPGKLTGTVTSVFPLTPALERCAGDPKLVVGLARISALFTGGEMDRAVRK